jgi:hypothetical protein
LFRISGGCGRYIGQASCVMIVLRISSRYLKNTNRSNTALMGGRGWQNVNYGQNTVNQGVQNIAVGFVAAEVKAFKFKRRTWMFQLRSFRQSQMLAVFIFNSNAMYYIKLVNDLSWNFSFYGSWDSRHSATFPKSDHGTG